MGELIFYVILMIGTIILNWDIIFAEEEKIIS